MSRAYLARDYPVARAAYRDGEFVCGVCDGGPANECGCRCPRGPVIDSNWIARQAIEGNDWRKARQ